MNITVKKAGKFWKSTLNHQGTVSRYFGETRRDAVAKAESAARLRCDENTMQRFQTNKNRRRKRKNND